MKWIKLALLTIMVLAVLAVIAIIVIINPLGTSPLNNYQTDGRLQLEGLVEPVRVVRDENGMAYIYAQNMADLIMAQGFVTAQDRLFQMELTKRFASGRIGELAGIKARAIDVTMRTLGFRRQAARHLRILDADTRSNMQRYVDGINAFIDRCPDQMHLEFKLAGISPERWVPEDPLTILYFMGWNSAANVQNEVVAQTLVEELGSDRAADLFPLNVNATVMRPAGSICPMIDEWPIQLKFLSADRFPLPLLPPALKVGSNNWVVAPSRALNGKPILANDPHLDASMLPGPWYPSGLILPDNRAVGVVIPGTPGIVVGRTRHMAFGVTNAYGDAQDLYVETVAPGRPTHYMEGDNAIAFQTVEEVLHFKDKKAPDGYASETITIRSTKRGPVVSQVLPSLKTDKVITVRWAAFETMTPSIGFDQFFSCRTADQFRQALRSVTPICLNYVFADNEGNIGWHVTGRLPIRAQGDGTLPYRVTDADDNWQGWIPFEQMPHAANPEEGWIGTTNNKTILSDYPYYYSNYFAPPHRQQRLMELMAASDRTSSQTHWSWQRDSVNLKARAIAGIMGGMLQKNKETAEMGRLLVEWNCVDDPNQPAPTIFHQLYYTLARLVFEDEMGHGVAPGFLSNTYFWEQRLVEMIGAGQSKWFDDVRTPDAVETFETMLHRAALETAAHLGEVMGDSTSKWLWGRYHRYEFVNPVARRGAAKRWLGGGNYPAEGSGDTLCRAKSAYDDLTKITVMASLRVVIDLADQHKMMAVLPGGVTGRLFHVHTTDQIPYFMDGRPQYWWFSDDQITAHMAHQLTLSP